MTFIDSITETQSCLLLLDSVIDAAGCRLVGPEQTDCASVVWIQRVPSFVPYHQVQSQNAEQYTDHENHLRRVYN